VPNGRYNSQSEKESPIQYFYSLLSRGLIARAQEVLPDDPEARAHLLELTGHSEEAEQYYRRADKSGQASWHTGLARCLQHQGRWEESLEHFQRAEQLSNDRWSRLAQAEVLLASGRWQEGWEAYEARFEVHGITRQQYFERCLQDYSPPFVYRGQPEWHGQDYHGQTLLVWKEQGDGDCFQFLRLLKLAKQRGGRLVFACPCSLLRLLQRAEGVDLVSQKLPAGLPPVEFHQHIPLLSLARVLQITPANLPPPECLQNTRRPQNKIGLVWAGQRLSQPERRSIALQALAPLAQTGRKFVSLQKGPDALQAAYPPPGMQLETPELHDWADTAKVIDSLDLLISIDTGVAHLAGALGCPTWLLANNHADWRWRGPSWYPKLSIFQQPGPDDWTPPIQKIQEALCTRTC
jgi:tetratricopeptide (TPR) repeat protein